MSDPIDSPAPLFILAPPLGLGAHLAAALGRLPGFAALPATQLFCADTPRLLADHWGPRMSGHDHGLIRAHARYLFGAEDDAAAQQAADWLDDNADQPAATIMADLQFIVAPRRLIDPSFLYAIEDSALPRIARAYPDARFIHLLRHPAAALSSPDLAAARGESLWLRPHLRIHAFLAERDPLSWLRLRIEALAEDPAGLFSAVLDWLGMPSGPDAIDRLLDPATGTSPAGSGFAGQGPALAPHGVDPALVADPALDALFMAPKAPEWDEADWAAAGFDDETRAMARLFGYI